MRLSKQAAGFTLIELVIVIVVLGILSVVGTQFVVNATTAYNTTQTRALLTNTGRQAIERMVRQLRGALPYSVRVTNSGSCLEFMPIAAGGFYEDLIDTTATLSSLNTGPYTIAFGVADNITIGALSAGELYGAGPASLSGVTGTAATSVSFQNQMWARNSQVQRFFLVNNPQAFCLTAGQLLFYEDISPLLADVNLAGFDETLARNAAPSGTAFTVGANTAENNIRVTFSITFTEGRESIDFVQEVLLKNVP